MRRILPFLAPLALAALPGQPTALLFGVTPAAAQMGPRGAPPQPPPSGAAQRPPPAALPGLAGRRAPAPIPAEPGQILSPNDALFDAINRGDITAARDSVARGANLDARNVLGLTPLDAAVDQGRHEIVFYLLSVRGTLRSPAPPPPEVAETARQRQARERAAAMERSARQAPAHAAQVSAAPRTPRLFANDGGAPRPEIGFLGFDAGRPSGARPEPASAGRRGGRG